MRTALTMVVLSCLASVPVQANALPRAVLPNHTPRFAARGGDLGPARPSQEITVTVWLRARDAAGLEQRSQQLQDPTSGAAAFLSGEQFQAAHAPADAAVATVSRFLQASGLAVTSVGPHNLFVTARGTVAAAQAAFGVGIHDFLVNGRVLRSNTSDPSLPQAVAAVVAAVGGLSEKGMRPHHLRPFDPDGAGFAPAPLAKTPHGAFFSPQCFRAPETERFSSATATAAYTGNRYGQDIANTATGTLPPCGYQPSEMQAAYDVAGLHALGLDGTGQTIAIVDAFGSTTIGYDAAVFSEVYGLPALDLTVVGTPTASPFDPDPNLAGWAEETTLDVEWAHAIAPGAKIVLVVSPDNADVNLAAAVALAASIPGVSSISNSYGGPESEEDDAGFTAFETAIKMASVKGISVSFSSGDDGDWEAILGYRDVGYPASSPFATGVGGVSVALKADGSTDFQTGWGTNLTRIADTVALGSPPADPPLQLGFQFGAGGGVSGHFAKPAYQRRLPGRARLEPDIGWVADPYTGVEIVESLDADGNLGVGVIGGTSVACPMFSALWAIAAQGAGHRLGQAAPILYGLDARSGAITDVVPVGSSHDVVGFIHDAGGLTFESRFDLAAPLGGTRTFVSALYNSPFSTRWFVVTFGTDSSLITATGWDDVTGLGTPSGQAFVNAIARSRR